MIYECEHGHRAEINFGQETIAKCPTCGVSIHKFRSKNIVETQAPEPLVQKTKAPSSYGAWIQNNWQALIFWAVAFGVVGYAGTMAYEMLYPKTVVADVSAITTQAPVVETSGAASVAQPDINAISVKDFQATASTGSNIKISFNLANTNPSNPYPDLVITWIGGTSKPITVAQADYPHPQTPFTALLPVEFDIARPADATGVKVSVQYPQ